MSNLLLHTNNDTDLGFDYQIVRSARRKTLCVQIKQSKIRVLAPTRFPLAEITDFLHQKKHWIQQKLQLQNLKLKTLAQYKQQNLLLCNGVIHQLELQTASSFSLVQTDDQRVLLSIPSQVSQQNQAAYVKKQLSAWFKQQALDYLPERLTALSERTQLTPKALEIRFYKARWGSCNQHKKVNLNYLLMMTPNHVIDYVIIHELCHLTHLNHSPAFWKLVDKHCPQHLQAKDWLKENAALLNCFHL